LLHESLIRSIEVSLKRFEPAFGHLLAAEQAFGSPLLLVKR
jgi:hypothetical protein